MRAILQRQKIMRRKPPSRRRFKPRSPFEGVFQRLLGFLHRIPLLAPVAAVAITLSAGGGFLAWRLAAESRAASVAAALTAALPAPEEDPPVDEPVGLGVLERTRETDFVHVVESGETLSEIAYLYKLDFSKLALYNNLSNPNALKPGQQLLIPSYRNEQTIKTAALPKSERLSVVNQAEPGQRISIAVDKQTDGRSVTANFTLAPGQEGGYARYEWDLGDGRKSFRESTAWTYEKPGTYTVSLKAWDEEGRLHQSNRIYLDVPHPGTWRSGDQRFVTLDDVGDPFEVDGAVVEVRGYPSVEASPLVAAGVDENGLHSYSANAAGFFNLTIDRGGELSHVYLFVSPVPSRHADRADLDWYRTQFNTGTQSNCGPSMVSMALAWATGDYVPVVKVREEIGWYGDGGISFEDMIATLRRHGVTAWMQEISGTEDIASIVDSGRIAVLLYNTRSVRRASGDPTRNLFGAYYTDNVGHYVVVKGYSLDRKWLVVYDPIPSDWSANSVRYADGISMIGRNRYYPASELFATIRRPSVLVIDRPAGEETTLAAGR